MFQYAVMMMVILYCGEELELELVSSTRKKKWHTDISLNLHTSCSQKNPNIFRIECTELIITLITSLLSAWIRFIVLFENVRMCVCWARRISFVTCNKEKPALISSLASIYKYIFIDRLKYDDYCVVAIWTIDFLVSLTSWDLNRFRHELLFKKKKQKIQQNQQKKIIMHIQRERERESGKRSKNTHIHSMYCGWDINQNVAVTKKLKENQYVTIIWNLLAFHFFAKQVQIARVLFLSLPLLLRERFIFPKWNHIGEDIIVSTIHLREMSILLFLLLLNKCFVDILIVKTGVCVCVFVCTRLVNMQFHFEHFSYSMCVLPNAIIVSFLLLLMPFEKRRSRRKKHQNNFAYILIGRQTALSVQMVFVSGWADVSLFLLPLL